MSTGGINFVMVEGPFGWQVLPSGWMSVQPAIKTGADPNRLMLERDLAGAQNVNKAKKVQRGAGTGRAGCDDWHPTHNLGVTANLDDLRAIWGAEPLV